VSWYAIGAGNWTDATLNSGNGLWNSAADGSGSWGTPGGGDTADINGNAVAWQSDVDGTVFDNAAVIVDSHGGGSLTFGFSSSDGNLAFNASCYLDSTLSAVVFSAGGQTYSVTGGLLSVACDANWNSATLLLNGGSLYLLANQSALDGVTNGLGAMLVSPEVTFAGTFNNGVVVIVPDAPNVLSGSTYGIGVDANITGTAAPDPDNMLSGYSFFGVDGDVVQPAESTVVAPTTYGPNSSLTGTASGGSGGGASVIGSSIVKGVKQAT
jgi:hypothetical protein